MSGLESILPLLETAGTKVIAHYMGAKAAKEFTANLQEFLTYFTQYNYMEPLLPPHYAAGGYAPIGWRTNPSKSVGIFYHIYPDIAAAIEQNGFKDAMVAEAGLDRPVVLNVNSIKREATVRQRLGAGWPARVRKKLLQDSDTNPFYNDTTTMTTTTARRKETGRRSAGAMARSRRAQGFAGAVILRVLGLARVCGVYELSVADVLEIMAHAWRYEQLARNFLAALLGLHGFNLTRYGYRLPNGQTLGTRKNEVIPSEGLAGYFIHVGAVVHGRPVLSYPAATEQLQDVEVKLGRETSVAEHEPILMDSAMATALFFRPAIRRKRTVTRDLTVGVLREVGYGLMPNSVVSRLEGARQRALKNDVHGNPLWQSQDAEPIKVRVVRHRASQKLVAWISTIGDYHWDWSPAGVFGKPCACGNDPGKRLVDRRFRGIPVTEVFCHSLAAQTQNAVGPEGLQFHWVTGDLPLAMQKTGASGMNMYVQVRGECLYCAANNATAYGCEAVIAGGI
ncbi:hypothetical protein BDV59DRAFT_209692 [Aspergillus ambiguus]|uniref:uncharacterized protein n=1 Tax=Aspergillus ambiguus TaxID=176160 RepID=UPI003CCE3516